MYIESMIPRSALVRPANSTASSFDAKLPTGTRPTGAGVIDRTGGDNGAVAPPVLCLVPFGTDANNETFKIKVIGWQSIGSGKTVLWVPVLLCQATCTVSSTVVGIAGQSVDETGMFADTITVTNGQGFTTNPVGDTQAAMLAVEVGPYVLVEVVFDMNSSAAAANSLYFFSTDEVFGELSSSGVVASSMNVSQWGGTATTLGQKTMAASVPVVLASDQSAVPVSQSGTWTVQPGNTANTTAWKVDGSAVTQPVSGTVTANPQPVTSGGLLIYRNINLVATGILVKTAASQVYGWYLYNNATSVRFVKFYDKATAPTVGTDTPVMTLALPASSGANVMGAMGIAFALGIGIGATQLVADSDTTAPSTNDVTVDVFYK